MEETFADDPGDALAYAYDLIVNGNELGGGSFRIHEPEIQAQVFDLLALSPEDQRAKFGFLLDALAMGAPPHGGIALGIDRMTMVLAGEPNLRDVIAFPKNQAGLDPMSGAPSAITDAQLHELGLRVVVPPRGPGEMPAAVAQRLLVLAAVALLAGLARSPSSSSVAATPTRRPSRPEQSRPAEAGTRRSRRPAGRQATPSGTCGFILTAKSLGVTHPVLPVRREAAGALRRPDRAHRGDRQQAQERRPPVRAHGAARARCSGSTARRRSTGGSRRRRGLGHEATSTKVRRARPCAWPGVST